MQQSVLAFKKWLMPRLDPIYLKNRLVYMSLSQGAFLGEEFPTESSAPPVYPRDQCERWNIAALPQGRPVQHAQQRGLWVFPGAMSATICAEVHAAIQKVACTDGEAASTAATSTTAAHQHDSLAPAAALTWPWFRYGHGRHMVPLQPSEGVCEEFALGPLSGLRSHNCTDARTWPELDAIAGAGGAALRTLERLFGNSNVAAFEDRPPLFLQVQSLQRGASIGAHIDQHDVGGRAIMTAVVAGGGGDVRVGGVVFTVQTGDVYGLCGEARDDVDHEVYSSAHPDDRISVTVRYGGLEGDSYPFPKRQSGGGE